MRKIATALAVATLMAAPVLTAPSATAAQRQRHDHLHPARTDARGAQGGGAGLRGRNRQHGLRPWLVLARRLARLGVLSMLTMNVYREDGVRFRRGGDGGGDWRLRFCRSATR